MATIDEGIIPYTADWLSGKPQIAQQPNTSNDSGINSNATLQGLVEEIDMLYRDTINMQASEEERQEYLVKQLRLYKDRYGKWLPNFKTTLSFYCKQRNDVYSDLIYNMLVEEKNVIMQINS